MDPTASMPLLYALLQSRVNGEVMDLLMRDCLTPSSFDGNKREEQVDLWHFPLVQNRSGFNLRVRKIIPQGLLCSKADAVPTDKSADLVS